MDDAQEQGEHVPVITTQHEKLVLPAPIEPLEDTDKTEVAKGEVHVEALSSDQLTEKDKHRLRFLYLLPIFAYIMAVAIGTHATFLFLTATQLSVILLQFLVAVGVAMVGNLMFALALLLAV